MRNRYKHYQQELSQTSDTDRRRSRSLMGSKPSNSAIGRSRKGGAYYDPEEAKRVQDSG
jgi:hypothetical protein